MRRGLIADLRRMKDPLDTEAARELTHMRRILQAIARNASSAAAGEAGPRIHGLAMQGLQLTKPE